MKPTLRDLLELAVQYDIKLADRMPQAKGGRVLGYIVPHKMEIKIRKKQPIRQRVDTLIHELTHAFYDDRNYKATEDEVEEATADLMREMYGHG